MPDRCTCHAVIDVEPYFGLELAGDHDPDTLLTFHPEHLRCLQEWGLALDFDSPIGLAHVHWDDGTDDDPVPDPVPDLPLVAA